MKRIFLFVLFVALFCFAGCGDDKNNIYDNNDSSKQNSDSKNDDDAGAHPNDDNGKNDNDTVNPETGKDDSDILDNTENDNDPDNTENNNDSDDNGKKTDDFWRTCEGIIVCSKNCASTDTNCIGECYGYGEDEERINYLHWLECFNEKCAEDQTAECSAEQCAELDALCNVADAFEYKIEIPAPYGNATFAGDFYYIFKNGSLPNAETPEDQVVMDSFAQGNISNMTIVSNGTMISFAKMTTDPQKGRMVEVYQIPYSITTHVLGNPAVILRIKAESAVEGTHTIGVTEESEADFVVADIDSTSNILCYHAFGIGSFTIDKAVIETGYTGRLQFSNGTVELFYPQNIPELGGDAREILGVKACSLID